MSPLEAVLEVWLFSVLLLGAIAVAMFYVWQWTRTQRVGGMDITFLLEVRQAFGTEGLPDDAQLDVSGKLQSCLRELKLRPSYGLLDEFIKICRRSTARSNAQCKSPDAILFGELALFVAKLQLFRKSFYASREELIAEQFREKARKTISKTPSNHRGVQVFLGGSCNPTTWRRDVAIPRLKAMDVTFYNPQIENWTPELIEVEEVAKRNAQIKFFVIDKMTRGISSMVEIAYLAATLCELMVVLEDFDEDAVFEGQRVLPEELSDLNRGHDILCSFLFEKGIPLFDDIETALEYTVMLVTQSQSITHLQEDMYVTEPVIRGTDLSIISEARSTFDQYDSDETGHLSTHDVQLAVRTLLGIHVSQTDLAEALIALSSGHVRRASQQRADSAEAGWLEAFSSDGEGDGRSGGGGGGGTGAGASAASGGGGGGGGEDKSGNATTTSGVFPRRLSGSDSRWVSRSDFYAVIACLLHMQETKVPSRIERLMRHISPFPEPEALDSLGSQGVFLGGSVGKGHTWREELAIPLLLQHGVNFFNPNLVEVCAQLTPREAQAKRSCLVLLYFVSGDARDISTMVEAAHFLGERRSVVLCLESVEPDTMVGNECITARAAKDINRGRHYLADVANRVGAPVFTDLEDAVYKAIVMVQTKRQAQVDVPPPPGTRGSRGSRGPRKRHASGPKRKHSYK